MGIHEMLDGLIWNSFIKEPILLLESTEGTMWGFHRVAIPQLDCKLLSAEVPFHTSFRILRGRSKPLGPTHLIVTELQCNLLILSVLSRWILIMLEYTSISNLL